MKKWTKVLSSFVVATVMSTGLAAVAGCDSCDGDNGGHQHSYTWVNNGDGTHTGTCGVDGCDAPEIKNESHVWEADDTCGKCDAVKTPEPAGKVTVTFNTNGGSAVAAQTIDKGGKVTAVTTTKDGSTFEGWYENDKFNGSPVDLATKTFNADTTLYAKWKDNGGTIIPDTEFTVTFDLDGGEGDFPAIKVKSGGKVTKPEAEPTKEDFIFEYWVDEVGVEFDFENNTVTSDITIKAKWRAESQFDKLSARDDNLISEDFSTKTKEDITVHGGTYGNKGVYVDTNAVYGVEDGALVVGDTNGGGNIGAVVDFGILSGTVEGYFEFNMKDQSSGGNFNSVNFVNQGKTVLQIMAIGDKDGSFRYVLNGTLSYNKNNTPQYTVSAGGTELTPENAVTSVKNVDYAVEFKFDLANKKFTLKINGTPVFTDVDVDIDAVTGFTVMTSNSGKRPNTVDNIAVCGTEVSLADYKADLVGKLDAKFTKMTEGADATHAGTDAKAELTTALNAGKSALEGATDFVESYKAYNDAVKAMDLVAGDVQQGAIKYINENYPASDYTQNKTAYETALKKVVDETDPAKLTLPDEGVEAGETIKAFITELEGIKNDQTLFEEYAETTFEALVSQFDSENYKINHNAYADAMQLSGKEENQISQNVKDYDSYADAIAAVDGLIGKVRTALEAIDDDATMIAKEAASAKTAFDAKVAELLADVTDENVLNTINAAKDAVTAEMLADGVLAGNYADSTSAQYYVTVISAVKDAKIAEIQEQIEMAGMTVDQAKAEATSDFEARKTALLANVKDAAFAEELKNSESAPALDFTNCDTTAKVLAEYNETLTAYEAWLTVQLEEKTYTVSVNGTVIAGLTVIYGETLDVTAIGDPFGDNVMIDPDDGNLYADADFGTIYEANAVYGNVTVFYKTVTAVKLNNGFNWSYEKDKADMPAGFTVVDKENADGTTSKGLVENSGKAAMELIAGGGLQFEIIGASAENYVQIKAGSTGTNNWSIIGLKGPDGKYLAIEGKTDENLVVLSNGLYAVKTEKTISTLKFITPVQGTYTIVNVAVTAAEGGETVGAVSRAVRLKEITVNNFYKAVPVAATEINVTKDGEAVTGEITIEDKSLQLGYDIPEVDGKEPNDVNLSTIKWEVVSGSDVVSVDKNGLVTVIGAGSAQIKVSVTKNDGTTVLEKTIDVKVEATAATEITLNITALSVSVGDDIELTAAIDTVTHNGITWEVVGEDGIVEFIGENLYGVGEALAVGTVTIRVSLDGVTGDKASAECVVTVSERTATTYTYAHGDKADGSAGCVWNKNSAGSNSTSDGVAGTKIDATHPLTLTLSGSAKKATINMKGFTTSTGNAMAYVQIILKDAAGNVIKTISGTTPTGKTVGDFTFDGKTTLEITSETAFATIEIAHDGTTYSGKHFSITSLTVIAE